MKKESALAKIKPIKKVSLISKKRQGVLDVIKHPFKSGRKVIPVKSTVKFGAPKTGLWIMDKVHSSLEFSARHMKLADIGGRFNDYEIKLYSSAEDFSDAYIELKARIDSLDTGVDMRDDVLKGADWFNAERFPVMSFNSISLKKTEKNKYELTGNLTIGNITHTLIFNATLNGMFTNALHKKTMCGFTLTGYIDRTRFQLGGNSVATGVSNEIMIGANVELAKEFS